MRKLYAAEDRALPASPWERCPRPQLRRADWLCLNGLWERFLDETSGWFRQEKSDVDSLHIHFDPLHLGKEPLPQLLSEFGGCVWKVPEHSFNKEKT